MTTTPNLRLGALLASLAAAVVGFAAPSAAQSSALDPAFGEGGRVWLGNTFRASSPSTSAHVVANVDGGALVVVNGRLLRYDARGVLDPGHGYGEGGIAGELRIEYAGRPSIRPDGSLLLPVALSCEPSLRNISVLKLGPDGRRDRSYGNAGLAAVRQERASGHQYSDCGIAGIAVEPDGRAVVVPSTTQGAVLYRFLPSGDADESFGPGGRRALDLVGLHASAWAAADGSFALLHRLPSTGRVGVVRFAPGGEYDPRFGQVQDVGDFDIVRQISGGATAIDRDGSVVIAVDASAEGRFSCIACRFLERRDRDGRLVPGFGDGGRLRYWGAYGSPVALDPEGGLVVAQGDNLDVAELHRLDYFGRPDPRFSNGGVAWLREDHPVFVHDFAAAPAEALYVVAFLKLEEQWWDEPVPWRGALYRLRSNWPGQAGTATAVEYRHEAFGHYFVSSSEREQGLLDAGGEWRRTGLAFRVWRSDEQDVRTMYRFFSGATFAPRSTHFHTHVDAERDALLMQRQWTYEGSAFAVRTTEGPPQSRGCPSATVPLYRAYNNGQGGAPNHRYTTDVAVLDAMVARGWVAEGDGAGREFACVALP